MENVFYPVIWNFIIVIVIVTGVADSVLVIVFLPRVGKVGAIILEREDTLQLQFACLLLSSGTRDKRSRLCTRWEHSHALLVFGREVNIFLDNIIDCGTQLPTGPAAPFMFLAPSDLILVRIRAALPLDDLIF